MARHFEQSKKELEKKNSVISLKFDYLLNEEGFVIDFNQWNTCLSYITESDME